MIGNLLLYTTKKRKSMFKNSLILGLRMRSYRVLRLIFYELILVYIIFNIKFRKRYYLFSSIHDKLKIDNYVGAIEIV